MTVAAVVHQGGWDEILLFFGAPLVLFVLLRYLAYRRERKEEEEGATGEGEG
jgi:hypothetical protein